MGKKKIKFCWKTETSTFLAKIKDKKVDPRKTILCFSVCYKQLSSKAFHINLNCLLFIDLRSEFITSIRSKPKKKRFFTFIPFSKIYFVIPQNFLYGSNARAHNSNRNEQMTRYKQETHHSLSMTLSQYIGDTAYKVY